MKFLHQSTLTSLLLGLCIVTGVFSTPTPSAQQQTPTAGGGYCEQAGECLVQFFEEGGQVRAPVAQKMFGLKPGATLSAAQQAKAKSTLHVWCRSHCEANFPMLLKLADLELGKRC
ncbi:MAG: hypothetical protein M1816_004447 [Peltula sp. TS41687]|nr:MAG: hypothetical protein M1816_004447 [Peltula sp. TS41687]